MLVLREKTNHISIWIFIINVMKGVSLSTYLKVVFYLKRWIPRTSCSFQLTQCWCAPTRRTNLYPDWFRDWYTAIFRSRPDRSITFWKQSWLKCFNLNIPLFLIRTNFMKEIKKLQTLHRKTLKLFRKIKKKQHLPAAGYKPRFAREIIAKLLCDDNSNAASTRKKFGKTLK